MLLKLTRITLNPAHKSLRGQTKREGLATIEAVALALECLGENAEKGESLRKQYEVLRAGFLLYQVVEVIARSLASISVTGIARMPGLISKLSLPG